MDAITVTRQRHRLLRDAAPPRQHAEVESALRTRAEQPAARCRFVVPSRRPLPHLPARGPRLPRLGRRRQRVRRHARRLRLHGRRPRAPEDRRSDHARGEDGHALRGTDRGHGALRRRAVPPVPAREGALRELGHRSDDERDPRRARGHRSRRHREDRGLVPRSSRSGDVLRRAERGRHGWTREPSSVPMSLGVPKYLEGHTHVVPFNDLVLLERLLQERGNDDRVPHHRTGDDEHRHRRARTRLPAGPQGSPAPVRRAADLRRGEVRRRDRGRRCDRALRRACRISRASRRRSRAARPAPRSAGART